MNTIIVGFDGSEHSERALERAASIAGGASLVVVSAVRLARKSGDTGSSPVEPTDAEAAGDALEKAKTLVAGKGGNVRFVERHGDPADALVQQAEEDKAGLIVVGTRGLNFAQRALLGSVSTKVIHHATCDVLVVR